MNKRQAMKILVMNQTRIGEIGEDKIVIEKADIAYNIKSNDFELDLDYAQDLTCIDEDGNFNMYQGHCLAEVDLD